MNEFEATAQAECANRRKLAELVMQYENDDESVDRSALWREILDLAAGMTK